MSQTAWKSSKLRVAVHEVGHATVLYFLTGRLSEVYVYQEEGEWRGQMPGQGDEEKADASTWQSGAAFSFGGWAAVHLAITNGMLPAAPACIEVVPGDHGFLGLEPADEWQADRSAAFANPSSPKEARDVARKAALDVLSGRMQVVLELAKVLADKDFLRTDELKASFQSVNEANDRSTADD